MKNKMKLKKRNKLNKKIFLFVCISLFIGSFFFTMNNQLSKVNIPPSKYTKTILYEGNHNLSFPYDMNNILNDVVSVLLNISIKDPSSILIDLEEEGPITYKSDYIEDPTPKSNKDNPIIYIYNTHQLEEYKKTNTEEYSVIPNVLMASYALRERCNKKDMPTIVETSDIAELLRINNYSYDRSYDITRDLIISARDNNKTLKYFIDLHRDSINKDLTTLINNNKSYAKVLFIVGLENSNYKNNLTLMDSLCNEMNKSIKDICRGIYKKQGEGVNGIYNQDIDNNVILIEVGGVDNTIEEVTNTLDIFSDVLKKEIIDNEK